MRSRGLSVLLAFVCFSMTLLCRAQTVLMTADAWKEDARLEQKVSVAYQGGPMNELLARLVKESEIELSAANNTKEDLIVLMVTEQPLSRVMQKIARHFNFEWERSGKNPNYRYRLYQTVKAIEGEKAARESPKDTTKAALRKEPSKDPALAAKIAIPRHVINSLNGSAFSEGVEDYKIYQQAFIPRFIEFRELMKKVDQQEPLEWGYSPVLESVHEQAKLNLISDGFDSYLFTLRSSEMNGIELLVKVQNLADILNALLDASEIGSKLEEGWLTLKSLQHETKRVTQTPRPMLRKWAKRLTVQKRLSLDELAAFAVDCGERGLKNPYDLLAYLFWTSEMRNFLIYRIHLGLLHFYATLTPGQKEAARTKEGLLFSEMSLQQQAQYQSLLFPDSSLETYSNNLTDPLQNVEPSKFNVTLSQKETDGYSVHVKVDGESGEYMWEMDEEQYQSLAKEIEARRNDPQYAGRHYQFDRGSLLEETLSLAPDTSLARVFKVKTFQPAAVPDSLGEERPEKTEKPAQTSK